MRSYDENLNAELAREGVEQVVAFKGAVRNMDMGEPLAEGDIIHIPEDFTKKIFAAPIGTSNTKIAYMLLEITRKGSEERESFRFYPNMLAKVVYPVDEERGVRLPKVKTTGTACEEFGKYATIQEGMNALKGRDILVAKDTVYPTWRYGTKEVVDIHCYQYDLV